VLDIDSGKEGDFGEEDAAALVDVVEVVEKLLAAGR
jgi:putative methionine-R-sulfoxide reductase with GAF domain